MEQTADKSPIPLEETEVTQADVQTDVVVEEQEDDVVTPEPTPESDKQEEKPEEEVQPEEPKEETPKEPEETEPEEEEVPFHERPGVKKRLEDMEEKYSSKAEYWDAITKISQQDPEFRVAVIEKLEAIGRVPKGSAEAEKQKLSSLKERVEYEEKLPEDVRKDLEVAKQFRQQQETTQMQAMQEAEQFFGKFEQERPDIAKSPNPERTRSLIFHLANDIVERDGVEFEDAMDSAYKTILKKSDDSEVAQKVQENKNNASGVVTGTSGKGKKLRRLSASEKRAAEIAGMSYEEYVKYADASDEELFENI